MKVNQDVLQVLSNANCDGNKLFLVGQLDRKLYTNTNKVLEAAGGKWNRKEKAHIFENDATDSIEQILLTGEITIPQDFGYFPTPLNIANQLIEMADIKQGMRVLEPSAGIGNIASLLVNHGAIVDCYELLDKNYEQLINQNIYKNVTKCDFLAVEPNQIYDRVVMNPPFERQNDIKHVTHAFEFLKEGGVLISIMGCSVMFRENKLTTEFRDLVYFQGGYFEELPQGSFKESGTMVNTVIVVIPN